MKGVDEDVGVEEDVDGDDDPIDDRCVGDDDGFKKFSLLQGWISSRISLLEGKSAPPRSAGKNPR